MPTQPEERTGKEICADEKLQFRALKLRIAGSSSLEIAEKLGVGIGHARELASRGLAKMAVMGKLTKEERRDLETLRLETLLSFLWPVASGEAVVQAGDETQQDEVAFRSQIQAIQQAVKVDERLCKLLGLDAPAQTQISTPEGKPLQVQAVEPMDLARRIKEFAALQAGDDHVAVDQDTEH